MGKLVGIYNTSHTPFCFMPPQAWNAVRATRALRKDVPLDDEATNKQKFNRIQKAFETLRTKLAEAHPDVVVIFGDDQMECFDFRNFPSFAVYVGEEFEGALSSPQALVRDAFDSVGVSREAGADKILKEIGAEEAGPPGRARLKGHPELGVSILTGLMKRGFATKVPHYYDNLPPQCIWIHLYERFAAEIAMLFRFSKEYGTHW